MLAHLRATLFNRISSASFFTIASSSAPSQAQLRTMAVKDLVDQAIQDNTIVIFSKSHCPFCKRAKDLFQDNYGSIEPAIFELDEREDGSEIQGYLLELTKQRTVPNIFVAQQHIGGCDDTFRAQKNGSLAGLLK